MINEYIGKHVMTVGEFELHLDFLYFLNRRGNELPLLLYIEVPNQLSQEELDQVRRVIQSFLEVDNHFTSALIVSEDYKISISYNTTKEIEWFGKTFGKCKIL